MDYRAALILEDALESAPLRSLDLSENPLGQAALHRCICAWIKLWFFIAADSGRWACGVS